MDLNNLIEKAISQAIQIRRYLHQHPELSEQEENTADYICTILEQHHISYRRNIAGNGIIAVVGNENSGKCVGIRADIDALKMKDKSEKEWTSKIDGHAHACGHDGHQTWLMGAAAYMAEHRDFPGTLVCLFQGAEETGKGAESVVKSGFLDKYNIQEMYAAHDEPFLKKGDCLLYTSPSPRD